MKKLFFVLVLLLAFFSPLAFASERGHSHSHGEGGFDSIFFIISFGAIGMGLYAADVEKKNKKPSYLELGAAFFAGYFLLSFLFELFLG